MAASRKRGFNNSVEASVRLALAPLDASVAPIAVAYSGGMDSTALLHAAMVFCRDARKKIVALHVNHRLSPNAFRWEGFCRRQCAVWGVPISVRRIRVTSISGRGIEAAAREARYRVLDATPAVAILLGHHADDQAETMLFNLCRGSGLRGSTAMRAERGRYRRPLLGLDRRTVARYAIENELCWINDESNDDTSLTRNFLRHEVLPRIEQSIPGAAGNLCAASARFGEAVALLDELAGIDLGESDASFPIAREQLVALSEPRARNAIRFLLDRAGVSISSEDRLREAVRQLRSASPDRHPAVHFGEWRLRCSRGVVTLDRVR